MSKDIGRCFYWKKHYKKARFQKSMMRDYHHRCIYNLPWSIEWVL